MAQRLDVPVIAHAVVNVRGRPVGLAYLRHTPGTLKHYDESIGFMKEAPHGDVELVDKRHVDLVWEAAVQMVAHLLIIHEDRPRESVTKLAEQMVKAKMDDIGASATCPVKHTTAFMMTALERHFNVESLSEKVREWRRTHPMNSRGEWMPIAWAIEQMYNHYIAGPRSV